MPQDPAMPPASDDQGGQTPEDQGQPQTPEPAPTPEAPQGTGDSGQGSMQ
ncbi:MAG: hypothetical protein HYT10_02935 [Candidatus Levybacteria bacterium]|nr:hypothetical protein [Candidatus Levybacteria bacterium]